MSSLSADQVGEKSENLIDQANVAFWDELCGTQLAKSLGIVDDSAKSLSRFDDWYMDFYPYLETHIPFEDLSGKQVLEVGLGYGTIAQRIVESGAIYSGLDIAAGPVAMVNHRIAQTGGAGEAIQGSILRAPFPAEYFEYIVAIGCLHHTGALDRALIEVHRLLKPGGQATIMVYNAASYRQWSVRPIKTLARLVSDPTRYLSHNETDGRMRGAYDTNEDGASAPHTEFVTKAEFSYLARAFSACAIISENIGAESLLRYLKRDTACRLFGSHFGLDLYCRLVK